MATGRAVGSRDDATGPPLLMRRIPLRLGISLLLLAFLMAWPGGGAAQTGCLTGDVLVDINSTSPSNDYSPDPVNVQSGGTVCWTNKDAITHTATANNGAFDSGRLGPNGTYRATFSTDATILYHCTEFGHGSMGGTVRVGGGSPGGGGGGGAPGGGSPGGGGQTGPGTDAAPRLTTVRVVPARVCTRRSRTCPRPGARLRFSLSEAARVRGTLEPLGPRSARVVRRFSFRGVRGVNRVRLPVRGLRRGRYRVTLRAVDAAGNRSTLVRARFRIVR
jgi:plastocyanin